MKFVPTSPRFYSDKTNGYFEVSHYIDAVRSECDSLQISIDITTQFCYTSFTLITTTFNFPTIEDLNLFKLTTDIDIAHKGFIFKVVEVENGIHKS